MSIYKGNSLVAGSGLDTEYIRNQNVLSNWETWLTDKTGTYSFTAAYDGIVACVAKAQTTGSDFACKIMVGDATSSVYVPPAISIAEGDFGVSVEVKKGDSVAFTCTHCDIMTRYYKLRDYTGR